VRNLRWTAFGEVAWPVAIVALDAGWVLLSDAPSGRPMWPVGWALTVLSVAALAARQRRPLIALAVAAGCALAYYSGGYPDSPMGLALLVTLAAVARQCRRPAAVVAVAVILAAFVAVTAYGDRRAGKSDQPETVVGLGVVLLVAVAVGEVSRNRQERLAAAERRAAEAERSREEEARRRAVQERLRIARDLHDVAAHQISLINVQAGAALHRRNPETAFAALEAIRAASKDALREMRAVLGVLRQVDQPEQAGSPLPAVPSLSRLAELAAPARAAGLRVRFAGDPPGELPAPIDLAGYRIVQESLTNVLRHTRATEVTVDVRRTGTEVRLEITDNGTAPVAPAQLRSGNGIRGMVERAAAVGGRLTAAPAAAGGFRVRACLPATASSEGADVTTRPRPPAEHRREAPT
jgi:signal transduction histidine kinase